MFQINGHNLPIDTPFTDADGNSYPSNWLRLSTAADRKRLKITEVADTVRADDRFYWDGNLDNPKALEDKPEFKEDGTPLFVQKYNPVTEKMEDTTVQVVTKGLKSNFISQVRNTCYTILLQTDWAITRKSERGIDIPADIATYRADVLAKLDELETAITAVTSVEQLAELNLSFPSQDSL